MLRPVGTSFDPTLGLIDGAVRPPGIWGTPHIPTRELLAASLAGAGFSSREIVRLDGVPYYVPGAGTCAFLNSVLISKNPARAGNGNPNLSVYLVYVTDPGPGLPPHTGGGRVGYTLNGH